MCCLERLRRHGATREDEGNIISDVGAFVVLLVLWLIMAALTSRVVVFGSLASVATTFNLPKAHSIFAE